MCMKKGLLLITLILASTLLLTGCAQKLGIVSTPAGAATIDTLDIGNASSLFVAQENDMAAMSSMGAMSSVGTRKAARKPRWIYKTSTDEETGTSVVQAFDKLGRPVDTSTLEILEQEVISRYFFLVKIRNLSEGGIAFWLINNKSGKVFQFGEDKDDSDTVSLMFQKASDESNRYKYYYLNTEGRLICMQLNKRSVKKLTLQTIVGFDYKKAKIDNRNNVIIQDKFVKDAIDKKGVGGYEYINFASNGNDIFVNKTGQFNYIENNEMYRVYVKTKTNSVATKKLRTLAEGNDAVAYIPQAHYSLPVMEDGDYKFYFEDIKVDYTSKSGAVKGKVIMKYNDAEDISVLEYEQSAVVILGDDWFYALKDNSTIEKVGKDLVATTLYTTSDYDMTTITYEGSNVVFYGYQYSTGSAVKGIVSEDGTATVTTEALILPETVERIKAIGTYGE